MLVCWFGLIYWLQQMTRTTLIPPYGGELIQLFSREESVDDLGLYAKSLPSLRLDERAICDLELLAIGAFSPLDRFMGKEDLQCVLDRMRLSNGYLFPIPITLPIDNPEDFHLGQDIALRDLNNQVLAIMTIEEIYQWDREQFAQQVFGTQDSRHPFIVEMTHWGSYNLSGPITMITMPKHYDFKVLRRTPHETRKILASLHHENVVAFQTRNPLHRVHEELTKRAITEVDGVLLLHPVVGMTKPGDVSHFIRVRTYKSLVEHHYDKNRILLSLLPLAMRMGGPREALWHAIIRRNYGANHFIVGRDHAGPGKDSNGQPFYGSYDAQSLVNHYADELGMTVIPFNELVYLPEKGRYEEVTKINGATKVLKLSGTQVREEYLAKGALLPDWFTRPEVATILRDSFPSKEKTGACIWLTGLSGAGKSTTGEILTTVLLEHGRQVTLLDGDVVRTHLSKGLGFSKEDRDTNILRIGFVASEIVRHNGLVICAAISPYKATRDEVRNMVGGEAFIEIFVDTPLEVCEARDTKGLYAKARSGELKGFTGIDDPYEAPVNPEIRLTTVGITPEHNVDKIIDFLKGRGFLRVEAGE